MKLGAALECGYGLNPTRVGWPVELCYTVLRQHKAQRAFHSLYWCQKTKKSYYSFTLVQLIERSQNCLVMIKAGLRLYMEL